MVRIEYVVPSNSEHHAIYERLQEREVLERLKEFLVPLQLLEPLTVKTMNCGMANAYYYPGERVVVMCYEFIAEFREVSRDSCKAGIAPEIAIEGQFVNILFHEVAHAIFDILKIPLFGREEDAADQLAAFMLLQFGPEVARRTIMATAYLWEREAELLGDMPGLELYAGEHPTAQQRFYNVLCIAYGWDPETFGDIVRDNVLPGFRAGRCRGEYLQIRHAFRTLINPHLDLHQLLRGEGHTQRSWLPPSGAKC